MEDIKPVRITDWNPTGVRTKGRPKKRWPDKVVNGLENIKLRNWSHIVKERKAGNDLVQ
jgi:hypothetical protein